MTLDDVAQELIEGLGSAGDSTIGWQQVREWPSGAIEAFEKAGWIVPAAPATTVECPICEDNCFLPVHILRGRDNRPARAYVVCDENDYVGRVRIDMSRLRQWQITDSQIARWLSRAVGLKGSPQRDLARGGFTLGAVQGKKQVASLEFHTLELACLKAGGHSLPLRQVVSIEGDHPHIDRRAIADLVDLPPAPDSPDREQKAGVRKPQRERGSGIETGMRKVDADIGSPEWRRRIAASAANARHDRPGGSREKQRQIREIWASGKYSSRDRCAEEECAALGMSYAAARKALKNTPEP